MFQVKKMATPQEDRTMVGGSTECSEDESRGVNRGHVPVGFQKDHSRFILSHCSGSWREFEKGGVLGRTEGIVGCSDRSLLCYTINQTENQKHDAVRLVQCASS